MISINKIAALNPLTATNASKLCLGREQSLYNRLFIGHYKSVAYQAVSITLPKGCTLYFGFQFGTFYSQEYSPVDQHIVYHYSPVTHNNPSGNCKFGGDIGCQIFF